MLKHIQSTSVLLLRIVSTSESTEQERGSKLSPTLSLSHIYMILVKGEETSRSIKSSPNSALKGQCKCVA